jgi:hypothetical protein
MMKPRPNESPSVKRRQEDWIDLQDVGAKGRDESKCRQEEKYGSQKGYAQGQWGCSRTITKPMVYRDEENEQEPCGNKSTNGGSHMTSVVLLRF